jgi:hypothetical protein
MTAGLSSVGVSDVADALVVDVPERKRCLRVDELLFTAATDGNSVDTRLVPFTE